MIQIETTQSQALARSYDLAVVGAGPAGCAAALAARADGLARVLLIDLAERAGGALAAIGLWRGQDTERELGQAGVQVSYRTALLQIAAGLRLRLLSPHGLSHALARAVVLATGGREQTRGNLAIPGTRPAGVLTAGGALRLLAAAGQRPGRQVVVAGGGRWTQVAACMLEEAGAEVLVADLGMALIEGWPRISGVILADGRRLACDLLVLATPELPWLAPALAGANAIEGVFLAGAAAAGGLDAHAAAAAGALTGRQAAAWALGQTTNAEGIDP